MKNWKIGKGILVVGLMLYGPMDVVAQSVTYNHDAAKMNQITVGETGSGSLTPTPVSYTHLALPTTSRV